MKTRKLLSCVAVLLLLTALSAGPAFAAPATRVAGAVWGNGALYDTVLTPTSFNLPPLHSTDTLFSFMLSGLQGQRSVADAAPRDKNYNGGRWSVKMAVFTDLGKMVHDPDGDGSVNFELKSAAEVYAHQALGHLTIMDTAIYFECPLLP